MILVKPWCHRAYEANNSPELTDNEAFGCSVVIGLNSPKESLKTFLEESCVDTLFIEPGNPWENGYVESFNARIRDELLNDEIFLHINGRGYVVNCWTMVYNQCRLHHYFIDIKLNKKY
jgi:hypothetical protein